MSERQLVIAIDCDDVFVPTAQTIVEWYNRNYHTALQLADFYSPAAMGTWGTDSEAEAIGRVNEFLRSSEYLTVSPDPQAVASIEALAKARHRLHLVTGRSDWMQPVTERMLGEYMPGCFLSVEHTNMFGTVRKRSKGEVCRELEANLLIDDHLLHGRDVLAAGVEAVIVYNDYPWNKADELPDGMVRCLNWPEVEEEVAHLASAE